MSARQRPVARGDPSLNNLVYVRGVCPLAGLFRAANARRDELPEFGGFATEDRAGPVALGRRDDLLGAALPGP